MEMATAVVMIQTVYALYELEKHPEKKRRFQNRWHNLFRQAIKLRRTAADLEPLTRIECPSQKLKTKLDRKFALYQHIEAKKQREQRAL